jgi:hypothetical protein
MGMRPRLAAAIAVLGLVLAGCGSETAAGPSDGTSETSAPVPAPSDAPSSTTTSSGCPESGTLIRPGPVDGAMGLRLMNLELTNCGSQPRTLTGYPEVVLLDEDRQPFDVEVLHGAEPITSNEGYCTPTGQFDVGPQPVTLAPGDRAVAGVVWRNLTTTDFDRLVNAPYMSVAPAEGDTLQDVPLDGDIDLGTTGRLGVSAWAPQQPSSCP